MAKARLGPLLSLLLFLSSLFTPSLSAIDSFVYGGCSQIKYSPDSAYESNLNSLLTSLTNSAAYTAFNKFSVAGSSPPDVVHGLYQCRGDLSMPDCATCVARSVSQLSVLCSQTCGGAIQLEGCFLKYDNATFLGVEDKTEVMRKCGPSVNDDSKAMNGRDAVLGSMSGSGGPYRVSGSGDVQGVAQCVGDLSASECQDCLSEAIGRLKSVCGTAVYGEMYLAKCYAKYYSSGTHTYPNSTPYESSHNDGDGDGDGDGEKTFAIIIGLFAGVALLIVFLSFLRKVSEGNGK